MVQGFLKIYFQIKQPDSGLTWFKCLYLNSVVKSLRKTTVVPILKLPYHWQNRSKLNPGHYTFRSGCCTARFCRGFNNFHYQAVSKACFLFLL